MKTRKQVENQHLMGLFLEKETGNKEENSRRKTEREKTVLRNHIEILNFVYEMVCASTFFWHVELKISSYLDNVFLRISIPHSELV